MSLVYTEDFIIYCKYRRVDKTVHFTFDQFPLWYKSKKKSFPPEGIYCRRGPNVHQESIYIRIGEGISWNIYNFLGRRLRFLLKSKVTEYPPNLHGLLQLTHSLTLALRHHYLTLRLFFSCNL